MLKVLIILSLFASTCLALHAGVYGFASKKFIEDIKDSAWPKVQKQLENIIVPGVHNVKFDVGNVVIERLVTQIKIDASTVQISLDSEKNQIRLYAENAQISGISNWIFKYYFDNSGNLSLTGSVTLEAYVKLDNQSCKDGFVPKIVLGDFAAYINSLTVHTGESVISPLLNNIADHIKGQISEEVNKQIGNNGDIRGQLVEQLNGLIKQNYPVAIPIAPLGIAISTYVTNQIDIYDSGIQVPMEGFVYNLSSGYKQDGNCPPMIEYVDTNNVTNDLYGALGECTVFSAVESLVKSGFEYPMKINTLFVNVDIMLSLTQWDQRIAVEFSKDNLKVGVGIAGNGKAGTYDLQLTADAVVNVSFTKKSGLHKICQNKLNSSYLNITKKNLVCDVCQNDNQEFKDKFSGIVQGEAIEYYDVKIWFETVDNLIATGMPDYQNEIWKKLILRNIIDASFDVPQFCIAGEICTTQLDAVINENFISANVNF